MIQNMLFEALDFTFFCGSMPTDPSRAYKGQLWFVWILEKNMRPPPSVDSWIRNYASANKKVQDELMLGLCCADAGKHYPDISSTTRIFCISARIPLSNFKLYCRSGNIREVLIFENFERRRNSRIQESRENYFYNSATKNEM